MPEYPIPRSFKECLATLESYGLLQIPVETDAGPCNSQAATDSQCIAAPAQYERLLLRQPAFDSREVVANTLFYCKGAHFLPQFLDEAISRGAVAYLSEKRFCSAAARSVPALIVSDVRQAMARLNALFYQGLSDGLQITGITGTKGKSTTAYFLRSVFDSWASAEGRPASAVLSSIDNYDGSACEEAHMTTQENLSLYQHFANAVNAGCRQLTMEVTSQALKYDRVLGIQFDTACFTNFGLDHISAIEHSDGEDYLRAKLRIFEQCRLAVVNVASAEAERVLSAARSGSAERLLRFAVSRCGEQADIWAEDICSDASGVRFTLHSNQGLRDLLSSSCPIELGLSGRFNVENALAAIACALAAGAPLDAIHDGLRTARVPGRMELLRTADNKTVIVDYAHNLISFEALFASVRDDYPNSALSAVFGCPGNKAYDRRRDLAQVCARYNADVVLTEEDSGEEPTLDICNDIAAHLRAAGGHGRIIVDREQAILSAISAAPEGAVILVTGKGRETRQKRGREYVPVASDVEIVQRYIQD